MNLDDIRFEAYADAARRCRWLFLATVLLSSLILSHLYLETMGFQSAQLAGTYAHRLGQGTDIDLVEDENKIAVASKEERQAAEMKSLIEEYGAKKYSVQVTDNTMRESTFGYREIPFLGMHVPANDYVPVLSIFLVVFSVGLWLNLRSLLNIVKSSSLNKSLKQAIHCHFTFTGVYGSEKKKVGVAVAVQYLAIWLPALTMAAAIPVDMVFPYFAQKDDPTLYIGPDSAILSRGITMVVSLLILVVTAMASSQMAAKIDKKVHPLEDL